MSLTPDCGQGFCLRSNVQIRPGGHPAEPASEFRVVSERVRREFNFLYTASSLGSQSKQYMLGSKHHYRSISY
jgi:hypothetical protein